MVLNESLRRSALRAALPLSLAALLAGCSVTGSRESPINEITRGSPTVVDIYRGQTSGEAAQGAGGTAQQRLRTESLARPIVDGDGTPSVLQRGASCWAVAQRAQTLEAPSSAIAARYSEAPEAERPLGVPGTRINSRGWVEPSTE